MSWSASTRLPHRAARGSHTTRSNQGFRRRQTGGQASASERRRGLSRPESSGAPSGCQPAVPCGADVTGTHEGSPYYVACLTNIDSLERPVEGARLVIPGGSPIMADKAAVATPEGSCPRPSGTGPEGTVVELPVVTTGAFVVLGLDAAHL